MSHELLLMAGASDEAARTRRETIVRHASNLVPGAMSHRLVHTPTATICVVDCDPLGGTRVALSEEFQGVHCALALNESGLVAAAEDGQKSRRVGAEAGHIAIWADVDSTVRISTDGIASLPGYWAKVRGELVFSSHLASLVSLGVSANIDDLGLSEYIAMLHPMQERTLLGAAKILRPGAVLTWQDGQFDLSEEPLFVPGNDEMTDDRAVATFGELWRAALGDMFARHYQDRLAIGLSGGLDSRSIATGAVLIGQRPLMISYGDELHFETRTARAVARKLGTPHVLLPVTDADLMPSPNNIVARLDGAHSPAEMYESWFAGALLSLADVLVNGSGGGQLWGDEKTIGITSARHAEDKIWARYAGMAQAASPYLARDTYTSLEHEVRRGIQQSLDEWDLSARRDMTAFWRVANRQVRWGTMLVNAARRSGLPIETPLLDARFVRFAANLTPTQRINGSLHLRVHRDVFTPTASIGRSDDGNSPNSLTHVYWSGEATYLTQLAALSLKHPVSGTRRAARRAIDVGAHALRARTSLSAPADSWEAHRSIFAIDLWARKRPAFGSQLALLVETAGSVHPAFDELALAAAAADVRAGRFSGSATALARAATANSWLSEYSSRAEAFRALHC